MRWLFITSALASIGRIEQSWYLEMTRWRKPENEITIYIMVRIFASRACVLVKRLSIVDSTYTKIYYTSDIEDFNTQSWVLKPGN